MNREVNWLNIDEVLLIIIIGCVIAAFVGAIIGYILRKHLAEAKIGSAEEKAKQISEDAKKMLSSAVHDAETMRKEALVQTREKIHKIREDMEAESRERRDELKCYEQRLVQKENVVFCST